MSMSQPRPADARLHGAHLDDVLSIIVASLAEISRHPLHLLQPDAELDRDLGITERMFAAFLDRLGQRLPIPPATEWPAQSRRTIDDLARFLIRFAQRRRNEASKASDRTSGLAPPVRLDRARELEGKVVLVTGSGRGIGRTYALRLAQCGAEVVVNSFHSRDLGQEVADAINAKGGKAHHIWASMANPAQIERLFVDVEEACGGLDFLVNNASNGALKPIAEVTADDMLKAYATNIVGVQIASQRAARMMATRGGGKIINLSTTIARIAQPHFSCMAPVKSAVEVLTRQLAVELAPLGIQVTCLEAGFVDGPLLSEWPDRANFVPRWEDASPDKRLCQDEDLAEIIRFLLGARASFLNGGTITVDGSSLTALGGVFSRR